MQHARTRRPHQPNHSVIAGRQNPEIRIVATTLPEVSRGHNNLAIDMNLVVPGGYLEPLICEQDKDGPSLTRIQFLYDKIVRIPTLHALITGGEHQDNRQHNN